MIENGVYRIVGPDGAYLGNPEAGGQGGYPVWQAAEDDVNPDRQLWRISLNPETDRYQIINAKDRRYVNELGAFSNNETSNPFEPAWHTYVIERDPEGSGNFAIRNGGMGGSYYWMTDGDRIKPRRLNKGENPYLFRFTGK